MEKRDENTLAACRYRFGQGLNYFAYPLRGAEDGFFFYITCILKTDFLSIRDVVLIYGTLSGSNVRNSARKSVRILIGIFLAKTVPPRQCVSHHFFRTFALRETLCAHIIFLSVLLLRRGSGWSGYKCFMQQ